MLDGKCRQVALSNNESAAEFAVRMLRFFSLYCSPRVAEEYPTRETTPLCQHHFPLEERTTAGT